MKLRNIKTTLENFNEAIKYIVFTFALVSIAALGLLFAHYFTVSQGEIYSPIITDILIILVLAGLTISSKGSISLRRTTLMILFGLLNLNGMFFYAFGTSSIFVANSQFAQAATIMLYLSFATSLLNVLILIFRAIILVQYDICERDGITQFNSSNFKSTFNESIKVLGLNLTRLFVYAFGYLGFSLLVTSISDYVTYKILYLEDLIIGAFLLVLAIGFLFFVRRYLQTENKRILAYVGLFSILLLVSIIGIIIFSTVYLEYYLLLNIIYLGIVSIFGLISSIYVYFLNNKKLKIIR